MNTYQRQKEKTRKTAKQFIYNCDHGILYSQYDIDNIRMYFQKTGKRYGLIREFEKMKIIRKEINGGNNKMKNTINKYQIEKSNARQKAIDWQTDFENHNYTYSELAYYTEYFCKLGKRYGLLEEFRENGII